MSTRPRISDEQRRARLIARHHLARTARDVLGAVRGVAALHSTDPATPYVGCWARVPGFATADLDRELFERRTLWRLHAMRRTLFVVPAAEAPIFSAGAGWAVGRAERKRLEGWLGAVMEPESVSGWLDAVAAKVLAVLADGEAHRTQALTAAVPELATSLTLGSGKWMATTPVSSRLLFVLAMEERIVRTRPTGTWRSSQYHWADARQWFGQPAPVLDPEAGRIELGRRYLATHGPATLADLRWWTGWTAAHGKAVVTALEAVAVELDGGREGLVLPGDTADVKPAPPHVALLPALDPSPMGWQERGWYLGPHKARLFDTNGNVGPTVWLDGRIVGGWGQRPGGEVVYRLLEDVGAEAAQRVADEAAALTAWADGATVLPRFPTPLERELSGRKGGAAPEA